MALSQEIRSGQARNTRSSERRSFLPLNFTPIIMPVGRPEYPTPGLTDYAGVSEENHGRHINPSGEILLRNHNQELIARDWDSYLGPEANICHIVEQTKRKLIEFRKAQGEGSVDAIKHGIDLSIQLFQTMNRLGKNMDDYVIKKMIIREEEKYRADHVAELRALGRTNKEAMRELKDLYNAGEKYEFLGIELSHEEQEARKPDGIRYTNHIQEMDQKWQRSAFGKDLDEVGRASNVYGEVTEFLDEFQYRNINVEEVAKEAADAMIALFGYFSVKGVDFDEAFLSRIIYLRDEKYVSLGKKRKHGLSLDKAMRVICREWDGIWDFASSIVSPLPKSATLYEVRKS